MILLMANDVNDIILFLEKIIGTSSIYPDTDIFEDLGVYGDDFSEMLEKYALTYSVDLSQYLWYFHNEEEGQNFGGLFFKPPYARVKRISVTPSLLAKFAQTKKWKIDYPRHELPEKRYDILINQIITVFVFIGMIIFSLKKWFL